MSKGWCDGMGISSYQAEVTDRLDNVGVEVIDERIGRVKEQHVTQAYPYCPREN